MTEASPSRPAGRPAAASGTGSGGLSDVRRDIDALDDAVLELLGKRFAIVEQVRELKKSQGDGSPLRPAREAQVLQRLVAKARGLGLTPDLAVWLWPVIFAEADLVQAPVELLVGTSLSQHVAARLAVQRRFGRIPVVTVADDVSAVKAAVTSPLRIAIVPADGKWLETYLEHHGAGLPDRVHAMGALMAEDGTRLVVIGQSASEMTGKDETLVVSRGSLPREFPLRPLWSVACGALQLSALPGYLSEREAPLLGIMRSNGSLGLRVAGRYPAMIG